MFFLPSEYEQAELVSAQLKAQVAQLTLAILARCFFRLFLSLRELRSISRTIIYCRFVASRDAKQISLALNCVSL